MKQTFFLSVSFIFLSILFLVSCQKEFSFENGGNSGGTANYSFDGGTGFCTSADISGTFTAGTPVTPANRVTLSVKVDSIGSYNVATNAVNGISFSGSGVFNDTGVYTITLIARGTPTAEGLYNFTPAVNSCTFSVAVAPNDGAAAETSLYSFSGGSSACPGAVVNGILSSGSPASSSNTVDLNITVDRVGTYNIFTNTVNGIQYTGTGSFTATGPQTVTLTASGTPAASGTFAFKPGSNGCSFNVSVVAGGGGSGNFLRCKIDGVLTNFNTGLFGLYVTPPGAGIPYSMNVQGKNSSAASSEEEFWVTVSNPTALTTGIYNNLTIFSGTTDRGAQVSFFPLGFSALRPSWFSSTFNENTFSVNITSINASGATGTFQGTLHDLNGLGDLTKSVTEGEFRITY